MKSEISRKTAAKLLKVSTRTVDRYVSQNKLNSEKVDGRIWLLRKEVLALKNKNKVDTESTRVDKKNDSMSIDNKVSTVEDRSIDSVDMVSTLKSENNAYGSHKQEKNIYKNLYEELKEELKQKQDRLEGANYRVGQLEAMVRESVPLLDHQKLLGSEKAARLELEEETESLREKIERLTNKLKEEKITKKVYFVVLFIILLMQPFLIIYLMK